MREAAGRHGGADGGGPGPLGLADGTAVREAAGRHGGADGGVGREMPAGTGSAASHVVDGAGPRGALPGDVALRAATPGAVPSSDLVRGDRHEGATGRDANPAGARPAASAGPAPSGPGQVDARPGASTPPAPSGAAQVDVRDVLLAVLLDDPDRAVGATLELAACQEQLSHLTGAVRAGRDRLGEAMTRLASAGLRPDQLARLTGLPADEVRDLLGGDGLSPRSG